jgi:hypothetical protein
VFVNAQMTTIDKGVSLSTYCTSFVPGMVSLHFYCALMGVNDLPHLTGQGLRRERLLKESGFRIQYSVMDNGVVGIAGYIQHLHYGAQGFHFLGQFAAIHAGHNDIGDKDMHRTLMPTAHLQRLIAVMRFKHRIPVITQDRSCQIANGVIIFHQKDGFPASS